MPRATIHWEGGEALLDEALCEVYRTLGTEACRRDRCPPPDGILNVDLRPHPDLEAKLERALAEATARLRAIPALMVQEGDFVRVDGYRFRVARTDPKFAQVWLERIDANGHGVSAAWCDGRGLQPETAEEARRPDRNQELDGAPASGSGADRARARLDAHVAALAGRRSPSYR